MNKESLTLCTVLIALKNMEKMTEDLIFMLQKIKDSKSTGLVALNKKKAPNEEDLKTNRCFKKDRLSNFLKLIKNFVITV